MAVVGLVGTGMEVVDCMHVGKSQGVVTCRSTSRVRGDTLITPPSRCTALGRVEPELIGVPGKVLIQDATRRIRFVVHAAGWLHSMDALLLLLSKQLYRRPR